MGKKQSKWMLAGITAVLGLSVVLTEPVANANTLNDLKEKQQEIENKTNQLNSNIKEKTGDITENQSKQEQLLAQIQALDSEIIKTDKNIDAVLGEISRTTTEIEKLQASIKVLVKKIAERDELIKERLRAVQQSGGSVNYLDVLLGASSFADFIDRFSAVNTLMDADRKILQEQADDKQSLETQQAQVEDKLAEQENSRDRLVQLKKSLDGQKASKGKLVDELEAEQNRLRAEKKELEHSKHEAMEVSKEIENKIVAEQARLIELARQAEIARKKKEAAERARQEAARKKSSSNKASSGGSNVSAPSVSSGTWTRPASGRFSSTFGGRNIGSGAEFHYGSDIANSIGTPIVAAADGIVSYAAPMGTYGNVIMITHSIDGQIFTTVYAHLNGYNVGSGQSVSKGQVIGQMGNTGRSTGPHLHFEIHNGPWNGSRSNAVNPIRYVSF
ncbi:murein hydrolase activator EnvC family protein [Paenisporosarcina quisquiliarum]|uniref:murein hydrolase activator EnvC family protein n=1 Tax=Paenisporosarcina quisquiliarum TaxID=365346 RepID=UPI0037355751